MCKFIKELFKRRKIKSYNISCGYEYHSSLDGGDVLPGDIPVAFGTHWEVNIYQGYFDKDPQWIVCSMTDKYWWIIPFTYDRFIFELPKIKFDLRNGEFTAKDVLKFVYNYARDTHDYQNVENDGIVAFLVNSKPVQLYETRDHQYMFRRLTGDYEKKLS